MAQHLTAAEKRKIEKLYLSGVKPGEIAHKIGIKSASLRQYLYREGLTSRREEIKESKQQTAFEVLARIREKNLADFEAVLGLVAEGLKIDAQKLKNAWNLVGNAADASSLQRAKGLHFDRVLRVYGLDTKLGQVQPAKVIHDPVNVQHCVITNASACDFSDNLAQIVDGLAIAP